jgi:FkbM family methyltransferase
MASKIKLRNIPRSIFYRILRAVWLRQNEVHTSWWGPFRGLRFRYVRPQMFNWDALILYHGDPEPSVTRYLTRTIRPEMTVYMAGGYIGQYALLIARLMQGRGRVYVLEGWPQNFEVLQDNIRLNPQVTTPITAQPACVAETSGRGIMIRGPYDNMNYLGGGDTASESGVEVPTVAFDDLWTQTGQCPSLLLLDIEGSELDALKGSQALLAACKPLLLLEHHNKAAELHAWLTERGYRVEPLGRRHLIGQP